jgi:hypothetical protein
VIKVGDTPVIDVFASVAVVGIAAFAGLVSSAVPAIVATATATLPQR